jgi:hypothetical protein
MTAFSKVRTPVKTDEYSKGIPSKGMNILRVRMGRAHSKIDRFVTTDSVSSLGAKTEVETPLQRSLNTANVHCFYLAEKCPPVKELPPSLPT